MDRVTHGNFTFLTNQPKETRQNPKQRREFAKKLFLSCAVSRFRDSKASSQLYSPDLCFELAVLFFCCCCCFNGTSWNGLCISQGEANAHAVTQHFQLPWKGQGCFYILGEVFLVLPGIYSPHWQVWMGSWMLCNVTSQSFLNPSAVFALLYPDVCHLTDLQEILFLYGIYSNFLYRITLQVWVGLLPFCVNVANPRNPINLCSNKENMKWVESQCAPPSSIYPNSYLTYTLSVDPLTSRDLPA